MRLNDVDFQTGEAAQRHGSSPCELHGGCFVLRIPDSSRGKGATRYT